MHPPLIRRTPIVERAILVLVTGLLSVQSAVADRPAREADEESPAVAVPAEIDLGPRLPAARTPGRIWLINRSEQNLRLASARGDCGCITMKDFQPVTIAPHRAVEVPFSIKAPKEAGSHKNRKLTFVFDNDQSVVVPVSIEAAAEDAAAITDEPDPVASRGVITAPGTLAFGSVEVADVLSGAAWLINAGTTPRKILAAKGGCGCITLGDFEPTTLAAGEARRVRFTIKTPAGPGKAKRTAITFQLADADPLTLPITMETPPVARADAAASSR